MLAALCLVMFTDLDLGNLDNVQCDIHEVSNSFSPTTLLFVEDTLYLGADLLEPKPGIYRLKKLTDGGFAAGLVLFLPQQAVEGLSIVSKDMICVASPRMFSPFDNDWANQLLNVNLTSRKAVDRHFVDTGNTCSNGNVECGIVGAWPMGEKKWLAATKDGLPTLLLLTPDASNPNRPGYKVSRRLPIRWERKYPVVTEFKLRGEHMIFLLRDRWVLASANTSAIRNPNATYLDVQTVFDFSAFKRTMALENARISFRGTAEGFDFDAAGNLYILLNNRGFNFRKAVDGTGTEKPRILVFKRKRKPSPSSAAPTSP